MFPKFDKANVKRDVQINLTYKCRRKLVNKILASQIQQCFKGISY